MRELSGLLAACALALASPNVAADAKALQGVWLIEPLYFDLLLDQGVATPEYPVLAIRPDGGFTLYRVIFHCEMTLEDHERLKIDGEEGLARVCRRLLERARADLGTLAVVSAAGRWQITDGGLVRFNIEQRGRTPPYFQRLVDDISKDLNEAFAKIEKGARDEFTLRNIQEGRKRELRRMETFYTTLYVLDGRPAKFTRDGAFLRLEGEAPGEQLVYRMIEPRLLQGAAALVPLAEVSAIRYFRCILDHFQAARPSGASGEAERRLLIDIGLEAMAGISATLQVDRSGPAYERLQSHPAGTALRHSGFGAHLGCPARDRM